MVVKPLPIILLKLKKYLELKQQESLFLKKFIVLWKIMVQATHIMEIWMNGLAWCGRGRGRGAVPREDAAWIGTCVQAPVCPCAIPTHV